MSEQITKKDYINYAKLLDDAMYSIIHKVLKIVEKEGLKNNHHFYISFDTKAPGLIIPKYILDKYIYEMTIVIQYQFENLVVYDDKFEISLMFDGVLERVSIPIKAITSFFDPSVQFGLRFKSHVEIDDHKEHEHIVLNMKRELKKHKGLLKKVKQEMKEDGHNDNKKHEVFSIHDFQD